MRRAIYARDQSGRLWWCNTHQRRATYTRLSDRSWRHVCDPRLGGITIPCQVVDLTEDFEIEETPHGGSAHE